MGASRVVMEENMAESMDFTNQKSEVQLEEEMENFYSKLILHHKIKYSEIIVYPKPFTDFLERKLLKVVKKPNK